MINLGMAYRDGIGTRIDPEKAAQWFIKAADKESPIALFNIGMMYQNGNGVNKDEHLAFLHMKHAAELNYWPAYLPLSKMYLYGIGTDINITECTRLLCIMVERGDSNAYVALLQLQKDENNQQAVN